MATLTYQTTIVHRGNGGTLQASPVLVEMAATDNVSAGQLNVTFAAPVAVPLGNISAARVGYFHNADATNFIIILDDATEIARVAAGMTAMLPLPDGVDLKAQADTANCLMNFSLFESA